MALKRFYMRNLYCKDMSIENWNNICNRKFVDNFSSPEARKHFLRLSYFRRSEENLEKSVAEDLRFTDIDDKCILPGNIVSEAFVQSCEKFIEICNQSLLLFGFKSHAKTTPDFNSAIKAINAIAGNWCGYTIKSDKKRIGPKG
ncbi:17947_t:CDS:2 [Funneliformis geosporum]|nr:17947_t:CDS:2 [Funneliformis geosporum]